MKMEKENIYKKLSNIQSELKAPKNQRNTFGNYNYRSCEDILEAVKPLLKENELTLQLTDELVAINERYYVKAVAILSDFEGNTITNTAFAREEETKKGMDASQITGTASSYARKYALNGLFCIDDTKDADTDEFTTETDQKEKSQKQLSKATKKQIELINELFSEEEIAKALDLVKKENIEDLTVVEASQLISKRKKVEE